MANSTPKAEISAGKNDTACFVQWKISNPTFSFQLILIKTGQMYFLYETIPANLSNADHIRVGVSDSYSFQNLLISIRRQIRSATEIQNGSLISLSPLPVCKWLRDPVSCSASESNCSWCPPPLETCSDEFDREEQPAKYDCLPIAADDDEEKNQTKTGGKSMVFWLVVALTVVVLSAIFVAFLVWIMNWTNPTVQNGPNQQPKKKRFKLTTHTFSLNFKIKCRCPTFS